MDQCSVLKIYNVIFYEHQRYKKLQPCKQSFCKIIVAGRQFMPKETHLLMKNVQWLQIPIIFSNFWLVKKKKKFSRSWLFFCGDSRTSLFAGKLIIKFFYGLHIKGLVGKLLYLVGIFFFQFPLNLFCWFIVLQFLVSSFCIFFTVLLLYCPFSIMLHILHHLMFYRLVAFLQMGTHYFKILFL